MKQSTQNASTVSSEQYHSQALKPVVSTTAPPPVTPFVPMLSFDEKVNLSELMLLNVLIKHLINSNIT